MSIALFVLAIPFMALSIQLDSEAQARRHDLDSLYPVASLGCLMAAGVCLYFASHGDLLTLIILGIVNAVLAVAILHVVMPRLVNKLKEQS